MGPIWGNGYTMWVVADLDRAHDLVADRLEPLFAT
jgi:hypothetical protein